jgi:hypothetical protein
MSVYNNPDDYLSIEVREQYFTNVKDPRVWGPARWFSIHVSSMFYPVNPTRVVAFRAKESILGLPDTLPCVSCSSHCRQFINDNLYRLDYVCSSRDHLFNFYVDMHNYVNERLKKPIFSYKEAWDMYSGGMKVSTFTYKT